MDGPSEVPIGEDASYTITIINTGLDAVENLSVRIPAPTVVVNGVVAQYDAAVNLQKL